MRVLVLIILLFTSHVWAGFSNYNSIIIGDQAAGMGGAYTAKTGDASACAFYNPATLALLKGNSFSAAVGIYKKFHTNYGTEDDFTKAALSVNQGFFRSIPSSTGSVIRYGEWTAALSILVPEYDWFKGELKSTDTNQATLNFVDESLWVGGAVGRKISRKESIGLTLYYTARNFSSTAVDNQFPSAQEAYLYNEEKNITHNAVVAILGYHYQWSPYWSWGVSYRFPSFQVAGSGSYFLNRVNVNMNTSTFNRDGSVSDEKVSVKQVIPGKFSIGIGYEKPHLISVAADLSYYGSAKFSDMEEDYAEVVEHKAIVNAALGAELYVNSWLRLRGGGFTNLSSQKAPDASLQRRQPDHVDQLGFSSTFAVISNGITYTFGGYYTGGRGESIQRIDGNYELIKKTQQVFTMLVGTSFAF